MNLADTLVHHAQLRPDHPAIQDSDRVISYAEVLDRTNRLAVALQAAGLAPRDRVAVMLPNSAEHLILLYALIRIGAVVVSLGPQIARADRERAVATLDIAALIAAPDAEGFGGLRHLSLEALDLPNRLLQGDLDWPAVGGRDPVFCSQSSGTTGAPKSILWSHARTRAWIEGYSPYIRWSPEDRYFTLISLSFEFGRQFALTMLQVGATVVIDRSDSLKAMVAAMRQQRVTLSLSTPSVLRAMLQLPASQPPLLPDMRAMFTSTAAITEEEHRAARRLITPNLHQSYGTNETGTVAFADPSDLDTYPDSVGRLLPAIEAEIVDEEGRLLPFGEVGRIRLRGPAFPTGYHNNPEASALRFRDGWFYPGDLAALNADRYVFLKGREDDVINNEGAKFYPIEVESALLNHPAVAEVACFAWPHPHFGEVAVACVQVEEAVSEQALKSFCEARLSLYKCPKRVFFVPKMPKSPTGKILKRRLKEQLRAAIGDAPSQG